MPGGGVLGPFQSPPPAESGLGWGGRKLSQTFTPHGWHSLNRAPHHPTFSMYFFITI